MTPIIATSNGNSSNFEPCPAGNHVARCYSMVHIGTIDDTYLGEAHTANKVRISFEFPTEKRVFKEENGEQPYALSKEFTLSMHEKSNLRKVLEGWRGRAFSEDEAKAFDITKLLGVPCLVNVIHKEKKDGGVRAEIASISAMPKGFTCPEQVNQSVVFTVNEFNWDVFETFPEWIKEKIRSSREYKAMQTGLTYFQCRGSNTVSGALSDLPSGLTYFQCRGSNTETQPKTQQSVQVFPEKNAPIEEPPAGLFHDSTSPDEDINDLPF